MIHVADIRGNVRPASAAEEKDFAQCRREFREMVADQGQDDGTRLTQEQIDAVIAKREEAETLKRWMAPEPDAHDWS